LNRLCARDSETCGGAEIDDVTPRIARTACRKASISESKLVMLISPCCYRYIYALFTHKTSAIFVETSHNAGYRQPMTYQLAALTWQISENSTSRKGVNLMTKIPESITKRGVKVYRPMLRVSRIFYQKVDAEEWIKAAQPALEKVYFSGPPLPSASPTGHRQKGPNGTRLCDKKIKPVVTKKARPRCNCAALGAD